MKRMGARVEQRTRTGGAMHQEPGEAIASVTAEEQAVLLRAQGLTFEQIADQQGTSTGVARARYYRALDLREAPQHVVEDARNDELERLYALRSALWDRALGNNEKAFNPGMDQDSAIRSSLQVHDRIAKMLGLNAPEKVELTVTVRAALVQSIVLRLESAMQEANIPVDQRQQVAATLLQDTLELPEGKNASD